MKKKKANLLNLCSFHKSAVKNVAKYKINHFMNDKLHHNKFSIIIKKKGIHLHGHKNYKYRSFNGLNILQ